MMLPMLDHGSEAATLYLSLRLQIGFSLITNLQAVKVQFYMKTTYLTYLGRTPIGTDDSSTMFCPSSMP